MFRFLVLVMCFISLAQAEVGEIISVKGSTDAYLSRNGEKHSLVEGFPLQVGDIIRSENSSVIFLLFPKIQMSLVKGTEVLITSHLVQEAGEGDKTFSLIDLIRGLIRIQVTRDQDDQVEQKVNARDVSFAVRGTEYEVSSTDTDAELDVFEGEVEVSSPHVQTFVPEIVKPKQGFRFERKNRQFVRRAFKERNREAIFLKKDELKSRWLKRRTEKRARKEKRWEVREERLLKRKEERGAFKEKIRERKGRGR